jgi:nitric oxide reductase subunit B
MNTLRWLRVIGDTVFALGAVALVLFIVGLATGHSYSPGIESRPRKRGGGTPIGSRESVQPM